MLFDRADEEGIGWSVIGFGGVVDVDAMRPVLGNLAEFRAVGEVNEGGPRGVQVPIKAWWSWPGSG